MRAVRHGGIIFVASIVGFVGIPRWSHYAATKGHTLLFAEGLTEELRSVMNLQSAGDWLGSFLCKLA